MKVQAPSSIQPFPRTSPWWVLCAGLLATALTGVVVANSLTWIGSTVPGFFLLPSGVVPPVSMPTGPSATPLFGMQVLAVDGAPLASADVAYEHARRLPVGTQVSYVVRASGGKVEQVEWRTEAFSVADYVSLFGVHLLNGLVFFGIALALWWVHPRNQTTLALMSASSICAVFFVTAVDRFQPHWFFGLHLMAQALSASALLHLALVFPVPRLGKRPECVLPFLYLPAFLFGLVHQGSASDALTYVHFHAAAIVAIAIGTAAVAFTIATGMLRATTLLAQRQSALAGFGILLAMSVAVLLGISSAPHGRNVMHILTSASFVVPLCIAYAAVQQDAFAIEAALRRGAARTLSLLIVVGGCVLSWSVGRWLVGIEARPWWPGPFTVLACVLFVLSVRRIAQVLLDRLLFDKRYRVDRALATLGRALASTRSTAEVEAETIAALGDGLRPTQVTLFVRHTDATFRSPRGPSLSLPVWRLARLERGEIQRKEDEGPRGAETESSWSGLGAEVLVPVLGRDSLRAVLALGAKESVRSYSAEDLAFLRASADQIAVAVSRATAVRRTYDLQDELQRLSASLERQVDERTATLSAANEELNRSLEKLQYAYVKLEQSQAHVLRSDRLATLGRLTAGLAHEMNTPLGAVLNSLKLIRDLGQEYLSSVDDADVLPEDHREIAAELMAHADSATEWAYKAAAFLRSVKAHGRDAGAGGAQRFAVRDVVADARALVAHRLRATSCRIELVEDPPGITLDGDPSRFNQVLVNLLTNAIDAYEDRGMSNVCIEVRAWIGDGSVYVQVRDWAGGIPTSILPHIFDELYTTKGPGRGTGLGLWISRNIVEEALGGTLDVITNSEGSRFVAEFPQQSALFQSTGTDEAQLGSENGVRAA